MIKVSTLTNKRIIDGRGEEESATGGPRTDDDRLVSEERERDFRKVRMLADKSLLAEFLKLNGHSLCRIPVRFDGGRVSPTRCTYACEAALALVVDADAEVGGSERH